MNQEEKNTAAHFIPYEITEKQANKSVVLF